MAYDEYGKKKVLVLKALDLATASHKSQLPMSLGASWMEVLLQ